MRPTNNGKRENEIYDERTDEKGNEMKRKEDQTNQPEK